MGSLKRSLRKKKIKAWQEKQFEQMRQQLADALGLIDTESADGVIGEKTPDLEALLTGVQAAQGIAGAILFRYELARKREVHLFLAQHQITLLTLVHRAYALGIREGQARGENDA